MRPSPGEGAGTRKCRYPKVPVPENARCPTLGGPPPKPPTFWVSSSIRETFQVAISPLRGGRGVLIPTCCSDPGQRRGARDGFEFSVLGTRNRTCDVRFWVPTCDFGYRPTCDFGYRTSIREKGEIPAVDIFLFACNAKRGAPRSRGGIQKVGLSERTCDPGGVRKSRPRPAISGTDL